LFEAGPVEVGGFAGDEGVRVMLVVLRGLRLGLVLREGDGQEGGVEGVKVGYAGDDVVLERFEYPLDFDILSRRAGRRPGRHWRRRRRGFLDEQIAGGLSPRERHRSWRRFGP